MPKFTFKKSEIQNGDIICFQRTLTPNEYVFYNNLNINNLCNDEYI